MKKFLVCLCSVILLTTACISQNDVVFDNPEDIKQESEITEVNGDSAIQIIKDEESDNEDWDGSPYKDLGKPDFKGIDTSKSFEEYGELDELGRCTTCIANVGVDLMPTEERGTIGKVKPTGWQTIKYDIVDGKYLYNRCHLIGYQLTAENANPQNLITGTRFLNIDGMLPFENKVADYVKETGNHVLYRVTPVFNGDELVAREVIMEAQSVEDNGKDISFKVSCYNRQPGIEINYADGTSHEVGFDESKEFTNPENQAYYVINENTKKYHTEDCRYANSKNTKRVHKSKKQLENQGYDACKVCNP